MDATQPLILHPSKVKGVALVAGSLLLMLGGASMVKSAQPLGWAVASLFGICTLVGITLLLPASSYLRITTQGFTVCSLFRAHTFQWSDVSEFGVSQVGPNKMVMFNFAASYTNTSSVRTFNASVFGYEGGLPDSYGLGHEELASSLNQYLHRYMAANQSLNSDCPVSG
jgi:hypothetical protein